MIDSSSSGPLPSGPTPCTQQRALSSPFPVGGGCCVSQQLCLNNSLSLVTSISPGSVRVEGQLNLGPDSQLFFPFTLGLRSVLSSN